MNTGRLWLLGGLIGGWLSGYLLMAGLLSSEGKLGKPQFQGELWGGAGFFGAVCVLTCATVCVIMARKEKRHHSMEPFLIVVGTWLPIGLATALLAKLILASGLLSSAAVIAGLPLLTFLCAVGWLQLAQEKMLLGLARLR